eukprot:CAMPEP_0181307318 /NCGR_PEP_ID=MMETSP1101-20121128/10807_1 /TAXON_ID=46948 /ORGANISM="Rhodomonas abbreviata, Strain Caron Lab Isolate" /LENGTH=110 /DNA_ID=CAMNT_0023413509 /DNA_START=453 /DNA_END=789 /DNA_ORIENTATION=+
MAGKCLRVAWCGHGLLSPGCDCLQYAARQPRERVVEPRKAHATCAPEGADEAAFPVELRCGWACQGGLQGSRPCSTPLHYGTLFGQSQMSDSFRACRNACRLRQGEPEDE